MRALVSWSGGKDSCYAMQKAVAQGYQPVALLNMMNENGVISRSHGLTKAVLEAQANSLGLPIIKQPSTWADYEENYIANLKAIKTAYNIEAVIFGDIDLQPHRDWEEKVSTAAGLKAVLPLWQQDRKALVLEMLATGIEATIASCNATLGTSFLGRTIDTNIITEFEALGVDACGENGEYHTVVTNFALMKYPITVTFGQKQIHENYFFIKIEIA